MHRSLPGAVLAALLLFSNVAMGANNSAFSHQAWSDVLARFVDTRGRVDYRGLAGDRETFDRYIQRVEAISPESHPAQFPTRNHELAYYLNAYNAQVFKGVLARGPEEKSVWTGLISGYRFFIGYDIEIGGRSMNLRTLENEVVREGFEDPRIHAALNCASIGCPRLPQEAFVPERLEAQLDAAIREFVDEPRNCTLDRESKTVSLSKIFDWFEDDFLAWEQRQGTQDPALIDYVNRYRTGEKIPRDYRVEFFEYDKRINKQ